jgi:hypothetical protein
LFNLYNGTDKIVIIDHNITRRHRQRQARRRAGTDKAGGLAGKNDEIFGGSSSNLFDNRVLSNELYIAGREYR